MHTQARCTDEHTPWDTVFFGQHTHTPFVVAGARLVTSSTGKFISGWSAAAWRLSKAVLSSTLLKLPEPTDYLPAMGICLPWPEFASLYRGCLPSPRGSALHMLISAPGELKSTGNTDLWFNDYSAWTLSQDKEPLHLLCFPILVMVLSFNLSAEMENDIHNYDLICVSSPETKTCEFTTLKCVFDIDRGSRFSPAECIMVHHVSTNWTLAERGETRGVRLVAIYSYTARCH